jgi:histidine ammonia-lyase
LCKDPLKNEPGVFSENPDIHPYNRIIEHANVRVAICDTMDKCRTSMLGCFSVFEDDIERMFEKNYEKILAFLLAKHGTALQIIGTRVYGLREIVDYRKLYTRFMNNKLN